MPFRPPPPACPGDGSAPLHRRRLGLSIRGAVQGVGFRPFVHRLATQLGLAGFVRNSPRGAWIEAEGDTASLDLLRDRLRNETPPHALILHCEESWLEPTGNQGFEILASESHGPVSALVLPDLATCDECLAEIFRPTDRRFRYPFANCTRCGPRYSIIESLPYDRPRTTLRTFDLCPACRAEYENPADRRFHAQPIACPACGPHLSLRSPSGQLLEERDAALRAAVRALQSGAIIALLGLGGFQLLVRADDDPAVLRLRRRKQREAKPFAVMVRSLDRAAAACQVSRDEARLLSSAAAPIVLLSRRTDRADSLAPSIAPDNPCLGLMLPYTPLHHLLLADLDLPVVATSGNLAEEPLCHDESEAVQRLHGIADLFLVHNRPIARPIDDSVARVILGTTQVLRRARGFAPLPVGVGGASASPDDPAILACGAHVKNAIALGRPGELFLGQHVGDLENAETAAAFDRTVRDLPRLLDIRPVVIAADLHPDYLATRRAADFGHPVVPIPHHEAHAWSCLADNELDPPALALSWDGTGLGTDGTIWGGEFLDLDRTGCRRVAWLRPFPLVGGDAAARDPVRSALGLLFESGLLSHPRAEALLDGRMAAPRRSALVRLLSRSTWAPRTSSMGRCFDGLAALFGLSTRSRFEGEAAMQVEWAARRATGPIAPREHERNPAIPVRDTPDGSVLDWEPFLRSLLDASPMLPATVDSWARHFHESLARAAVEVARKAGRRRVLLTGGCFQNRLLTELAVQHLRDAGFSVYWHQRIPPNDGGLAAGQVVAAWHRIRSSRHRQPDPPPCASPSPAVS